MKTTLRWLDQHFEEMLMAFFLCGVVVLMTLHVFFRYVMRAPLTWSEGDSGIQSYTGSGRSIIYPLSAPCRI